MTSGPSRAAVFCLVLMPRLPLADDREALRSELATYPPLEPTLPRMQDLAAADGMAAWLAQQPQAIDPMLLMPIGSSALQLAVKPEAWLGPGDNRMARLLRAWTQEALAYVRTHAAAHITEDPSGARLDGVTRLMLATLGTTLVGMVAIGQMPPERLQPLQTLLAPLRDYVAPHAARGQGRHLLHGSFRDAWMLALAATPWEQWPQELARFDRLMLAAGPPDDDDRLRCRLLGLLLARHWDRDTYQQQLATRAPHAAASPETPSAAVPSEGLTARHEGDRGPATWLATVTFQDLWQTATPEQWPTTPMPATWWRPFLLSADPAWREAAIRAMGVTPITPDDGPTDRLVQPTATASRAGAARGRSRRRARG